MSIALKKYWRKLRQPLYLPPNPCPWPLDSNCCRWHYRLQIERFDTTRQWASGMKRKSIKGTGLRLGLKCAEVVALSAVTGLAVQRKASSSQTIATQNPAINVRYTDVRQSTGIVFRQDGTGTEEKLYLETMGT